MKKAILLIIAASVTFAVVGCGPSSDTSNVEVKGEGAPNPNLKAVSPGGAGGQQGGGSAEAATSAVPK